MTKFLVTFTDTLDDIEINGFTVMTEKEVDSFEKTAMSITWPFVYAMGQDELEFSSGDDFLSRIDFKEITNEEVKSLKKLFGDSFGVFIDEAFLEEVIGYEDESDFDDDEDDDIDDMYDNYGDDNEEDYD
jgi:hypothetical protein